MDIFQKCYEPSLAKELKAAGVYPYFHALQSRQDVEVMMEGRRRIMLGSNNYLGLTTAPDVVEAGIHALEQYGTGCSGSRVLNGTLQMHLEGAVEDPGTAAPGAVLLQGMDARLHHIRGRGQTQIVVGTQHDAAPTLHHHLHILPGLEGVEIGIHPRRLQFLRQRRLIAFLKNIHSSLLLCNIKY